MIAVRLLGLILVAGLFCSAVPAQEFPSREITLLVPFGPGGPTDAIARAVAEESYTSLKQRMVVVNKPGASATLGTAEVFRARPDGYTLLLGDNISTVFQPLRMKLPYGGPEDFQPVIKLANIANVLAVRADSPWRTLEDFVAEAKKRPGAMRVSTAGRYTGTDLNMLELNQIAKIDTTTVPVSGGTGESVKLLLGGHIEAIVAAPVAVVGQVQGGALRVIATFGDRRNVLFPEAPSTAESGYKTTMSVIVFISAPRNLDRIALQRLTGSLTEAVKSPRFQEFARRNGYDVDPMGPEQFAKELVDWRSYFVRLAETIGAESQK
jgi:tripartite-type tricarboxylate transporter receptor subunit TctC